MIKAEFGIISDFYRKKNYTGYFSKKYNCVAINDMFLDDWWSDLLNIDTLNVYAKGLLQSQKGLSRWGITIIPPTSLPDFLNIVRNDRRYQSDSNLVDLAHLIDHAIQTQKYMIHYGV